MKATVDECVSIQVTEHQHYALQRTTAAVIVAGASLGHVHVAHACAGAAAKGIAHAGLKAAAKSGAKAAVKGSAKAGAKAGANVVANSPADSAEALFQLGFRAALSGTAIGIVAGVAVAINLAFEGPLLARSVYKLHRKKKFDQITQVEFKRGIVQESFISANTFVGAVGGAIVGQVAIPVPALGAAVGGAVGGIVGQVCGRAEGWAAGKLISDPRAVTILPLTTVVLFDMPPLIGQEKTAEK